MLNGDNPAIRETAAVAGAIDLVNDGLRHVTAPQEIRVQGMCNPVLDRVLRGRQCLAQHLPPENLRAADVPAVTAENIVLDALQPEERDQVFQYRVHCAAVMPARSPSALAVDAAAVDGYAGPAHENGVVAGEEQHHLGDVDRLTQPFRSGTRDACPCETPRGCRES